MPGEDGSQLVDLGALQFGMLEELEKARLYIVELHKRLEEQREELEQLEAALEDLSR